ncbi:MAG: VWA domain-containing protein [Candidatus Symbiothrix sp.]|jgi:Ca-activated chloride channel family protein|nr:VWA domain-containing protein [Candidatus Symbiothrix sp.]
MFRFEHPICLYLLLLLPVLVVVFYYGVFLRRKALKRFGTKQLVRELMPDAASKKQHLKFWLLLASVALFVVVIAGPQFGSKLETVKKQGIEVMICLDVSNSMMAEDVSPNRLAKAKQLLSRLVDDMNNDKVGLIVFAGDAYIQLPITSDYVSAKMFLSSINPSMVPTQGTAIGSAIRLALSSFTPNESSTKTIILITDGENHEDNAVEVAKAAAEKGISVNVLGIGSPMGSPIPTNNGYMKDSQGNMVLTVLNEKMCEEIAVAGQGLYARVDNSNGAVKALQKELDTKAKSEVESKVYSSYDEKYQIAAAILLILLLIEFFILERKNRVLNKIKLFKQ